MSDHYRTEIPGGVLYTTIAVSASGSLITGVTGKKIVVLSAWAIAAAAVNIKFKTSTGSADITGLAYCAQNGGFVLPYNACGWFATERGDSLLIDLSGSVAVGGSLSYVLV